MKAELISVGTELLLGEIVDTNASWIAARLPRIGLDLYHKSVVGDNLERVVDTIERALSRSDVVIMTGGLGPTEDDLTREAIAEALGEEMFVDPDMERALRAFFSARGVDFAESNVKQAKLIPSASALANPRGTAPGWFVEKNRAEGERYIIAMPGVPAEMYRMWENEVAPRLREMTGEVLITRVLKTAAVSEAKIDEMLSPLLKSTNPSVGIYAKIDGVHARIGAKAATEEEARALIAPVEEEARRILGPAVWGADEETLEAAVGQMLRERGQTVATMESCTGGLLSSAITDVDGSSEYFKGGYVAYTTELKVALGVDQAIVDEHGLISSETAGEMARAAREALGADYGVGVTGIAGPDAVEGKPPGTIHVAIHDGTRAETITYTYNQGRVVNKRRAVNASLFLLRRTLLAAGA
ncbi:MAG: competence/damage-inducible protein A [Chloroflexi bacterium]|nr:competence/damage-inducible protein A [Chloroflexota bacterium]MCI0819749.1 competence/damage-inducible protein A [Chloroflexota bacterium]MCI0833122.1 competence/damage-inducible protein A [Chloroflexota bacterium]MCI0839416.1 competence/damage-inducible protein A [Chloroflexota bacterium]MCI0843548.1 competence/damage-inducible protein A [Chloroflexota bacterium]